MKQSNSKSKAELIFNKLKRVSKETPISKKFIETIAKVNNETHNKADKSS